MAYDIHIIGGGLAGSEAAWQLAKRGLKVRLSEMRGSGDITSGPAMPHHEAVRLLLGGAELAGELAADGITAVALGEMGIAFRAGEVILSGS